MQLPEDDEAYLESKGFKWRFEPENHQEALLIIEEYPIDSSIFDRDKTDLMIRIPAQYNMAGLDMFYVDPPVRLKSSECYPDRANQFEKHGDRTWQRFSRHLPCPWRPGVDGLSTLLVFVRRELQGRG